MRIKLSYRRKIAVGFLTILIINICAPCMTYALTSGPTQPEARSFQPAGTSDMVDLFSGDFKYNIPLLDIDGYPVNLNYASGSGMDDEASWVGLGWNVNVGAINRQVRGVPDDMAGDKILTDDYTKPKVTVGGRVSIKTEVFGIGNNLAKVGGSFSLGVFSDNYTGVGGEISANAGISFGNSTTGPLGGSLGLGINSNTASGVEVTPTADLGTGRMMVSKTSVNAGLSASLGYNTRSGIKGLTLGASFSGERINSKGTDDQGSTQFGSVNYSFNTEPILPTINVPYRSVYGSASLDIGPTAEGFFAGFGFAGYVNTREIATEQQSSPAYGFLYAERGKNQQNAVMDFQREKDNPIIPEIPNLALPVATPDMFSYTSQTGSGQFRLYRGGSGAFFDHQVSDVDLTASVGGDFGVGYFAHGGYTLFAQKVKSTTSKWTSNNSYLPKADFQDISYTNPNAQQVYFKELGEKSAEDANMVAEIHDVQPLAVSISGINANASFTNNSLTNLQKQSRQVTKNVISYLTAQEASVAGLDKNILDYPLYTEGSFVLPANNEPTAAATLPRVDNPK